MVLAIYIGLASLLHGPIREMESETQAQMIAQGAARVAVALIMLAIRDAVRRIPTKLMMGAICDKLAFLWKLSYKAEFFSFVLWLFPGMPNSPVASLLVIAAGISINVFDLLRMPATARSSARPLIGLAMLMFCDVVAAIGGFLIVFAYNNVTIGISLARAVVYTTVAKRKFSAPVLTRAFNLGVVVFKHWYWLVLWIMASPSALACGACMVMKHDGMIITFKSQFEEWKP